MWCGHVPRAIRANGARLDTRPASAAAQSAGLRLHARSGPKHSWTKHQSLFARSLDPADRNAARFPDRDTDEDGILLRSAIGGPCNSSQYSKSRGGRETIKRAFGRNCGKRRCLGWGSIEGLYLPSHFQSRRKTWYGARHHTSKRHSGHDAGGSSRQDANWTQSNETRLEIHPSSSGRRMVSANSRLSLSPSRVQPAQANRRVTRELSVDIFLTPG